MITIKEIRILIISLILITCPLLLSVSLAAEEGNTETKEQERTDEQKLGLIQIYTWANKLPKDLIDLRNDISALADLSTIQDKLPEITKQIDEELQWQATTLSSNPNLTFHELTQFEAELAKLSARLNHYTSAINTNIEHLETWYRDWLAKQKEFEATIDQTEKNFELQDSLPDVLSLSEVIVSGKELIEEQLRPTLLAGHGVGKLQTKVYALSTTAVELAKEMNVIGTQQTSPSMLSRDFYDMVDKDQLVLGWENVRLFCKYQWGYFTSNLVTIAITLAVILLLSFSIRFSASLVTQTSDWYIFASRPLVTAVFVFCTVIGILNTLAIDIGYPPDWETLIYLPMLVAVARLINNVCPTAWQVPLCRHLLIYVALSLLLTIAGIPRVLFYLFVFYASLLLLAYYLWLFFRHWADPSDRKITWAILIWGAFPLTIIVAGASGFDQLAVVLFGRILSVIAVTIIIRLMLLFVSGLIEMALNTSPWEIIKKNASTIVDQITPLLALLHFILWVALILTITWMYPTLNEAFAAMTSLQFTVSTVTITPGSILSIILIIYITLLISRALQAFLLQEVFSQHRMEKGVQISITRLIHYAVMTIGFLILLWALGFGLNQITILGGALGVGIGFGLQAIVNNFVSGLILLFERPIKVGDMIDIGEQVGEVKELGLRATTVQTFDNAEIVIPNSQLITGSVTNWTLAEKKIRVRVPVGVAYGSDIEAVLKILLACADANPIVLNTPKPIALFLAFGDSSLDFELRVWIPDFNDKMTVLSELNQDIESEFQTAGIEIPFPQTDLHLRSVDMQAAQTLSSMKNRKNSSAEDLTEQT